jgi:acetylornithine deacetylase
MTHLRGYKADAVLIPEPEDEMLIRANVGVLWFRRSARCPGPCAREGQLFGNAIDAAYRIIFDLRRREAEWSNARAGRDTPQTSSTRSTVHSRR